ncbi:MAG: vitamin B12 dependent-methionine synthase activation domain-containing protein [Pyramidobacter sp.]
MVPTQRQIDDALRYLKIPREKGGNFTAEVLQAFSEVHRTARPGKIWARFALEVQNGCIYIGDGSISCRSVSLAQLFRNCRACIVMAVTLGPDVDRRTRTLERSDMTRGLIFDACASVLADSLCDEAESEAGLSLAGGEFLTMRFSPGYGDVPLSFSADILKMLDAGRRIGVTLTERGMMIPVKSVTALAGISDRPERHPSGCDACGSLNCPYRRRGSECHDKKI